MSAPRWSSLEGWLPDPQRRGFLRSDGADDSWRRTADGRWWSRDDIDAAQVVVDEVGRVLELRFEPKQQRLDAARATLARLPLTPGDRAANEVLPLTPGDRAANEVLDLDRNLVGRLDQNLVRRLREVRPRA